MVDVTVRGAGIFGLSIAWACVQRGARVRVIDPHGPGAGASGGIVGALAPHVPENWNTKKTFQFDSLMMAGPFWAAVEEAGGVHAGYGRTGRLQPVADGRQLDLARARENAAKELWQGKAEWRICAADDLGPFVPPSPSGFVIRDTLSARIHPRQACAALAAALRVHGTEITPDAADQGQVVWATGSAGLAEISQTLARPIGGAVKGQAALLRFDARDAPQIFMDALHLVPHSDGTLAIGSTSERTFDSPDATDDALDDVIARAMQAMPLLHGAHVIERWAGLRPRTRSRAPMLGAHPTRPGQFIANGGFKIGFGMAPKIAEVMADLLLDRHDHIPQEFRPDASL